MVKERRSDNKIIWEKDMVKERRSAKRIKYDMVRVYSKMETHVDGKAKSVFKRKPYALAK